MEKPRLLYTYHEHHMSCSGPVFLPYGFAGIILIDGRDFVTVFFDEDPPTSRRQLPSGAPSRAHLTLASHSSKLLIEDDSETIWIADVFYGSDVRPLASGFHAVWSPNDDAIAFHGNVARGSELLVMRPTGIPFWSVGSFDGRSVSWSPSGSQLVSIDDRWVTIVNTDGSDRRMLAHLKWYGWGYDPKWSPRGDLIAFHQFADENRVFVIDLNGSLVHTFAGFKNIEMLAWSPDGERLICEDMAGIHLIDVDSERQALVAEGHGPRWSRSGKQILFLREGSVYLTDV